MAANNQQQADKRIIGFDCEFVKPPPSEFVQSECPVCLQIIREPHQVTCCGNKFCKACIEHIKAIQKSCPTCNEKFSSFPDKGLKRSLYSLKVRCSQQKDGCEWMKELRQLDEHLNTDPQPEKQLDGCQFVEINCIYNCRNQLQRRYIQNHQIKDCPKRPFGCEHCHDYKSTYDDVTNNHWPVCGSFPVPCPNQCGSTIQHQNIDSHIANECLLTTINCDFHHVGCAVKPTRQDMPEHQRENLLTHISLLATSHAKQQDKITNLVDENDKQKESYKSNLTALQTKVTTLEQQNTASNAEIKSSKTNLTALQTKVTTLEQEKQLLTTNAGKQQADIASLVEEKKQMKIKIAELAQLLTPYVQLAPCTAIPLGPPVLTMTNYQQHKRDDDQWYSPPVYTHHQGYNICLCVNANGYSTGKGTHVSVFVCFRRGEFDNSLKWPFRGVISYQLLNQVDGKDHKTHTITYDDKVPNTYCTRVTEGERGLGWGHPQFFAHTKLEPKYLQNDTLLFQIHKVELK
ncbi:TNF receptor-associated factor 4-like [Halichondria panicea]|uniref:TNF receptor-associated factor 4-like n=1 Tax=Halichondria panicea TaxID=6063 RepID=UPI00312B9547